MMKTEGTIEIENFQEEKIETLIRIGRSLEEETNIKTEISVGINLEEGINIKKEIEKEKKREIDIEIVIVITVDPAGIMKDSVVMKDMEVVKDLEVKKDLDLDPKKTIKENFRNMVIIENLNNVNLNLFLFY